MSIVSKQLLDTNPPQDFIAVVTEQFSFERGDAGMVVKDQ